MEHFVKISGFLSIIAIIAVVGCGGSSSNSTSAQAVKPPTSEVKTVYDQVNDAVNLLCSSDVNTGTTATYSYVSGTLKVNVTATAVTVYPLTCVYILTNFVSGSYTLSGTSTAIVTADNYWTASGTLTGTGGDIQTIAVNMSRNGDPNIMTGTLTVNGYAYDYATASYK